MAISGRFRWALGVANQYGFRLVLGQIPRLVYGNDAGFFHNLGARRELKKIQRKAAVDSFAGDPRADFLQRQGYLRVDPNCGREIIRKIVEKYELLIQDDQHSKFIGPRIREAARGTVEPIRKIPELRFLLTDEVQELVRAYYRAHLKVLHVRCWRNYHVGSDGARQDVYSNLWHNDQDPVTQLRYFVCLTDGVNAETGALRLHPIPSTRQLMYSGYFRRRAIVARAARMIEDPQRMMIFEGNCGSGCLVNPQLCLHRAGVPAPGKHRDMIQFSLAPSEQPLSKTWYLELPPDPDALR